MTPQERAAIAADLSALAERVQAAARAAYQHDELVWAALRLHEDARRMRRMAWRLARQSKADAGGNCSRSSNGSPAHENAPAAGTGATGVEG